MALLSGTIGFPRTGPKREMKKALELYWANPAAKGAKETLLATAAEVEAQAWRCQAEAGVDLVGLDGTLYDQVLDFSHYLGLLPKRFQHLSGLDRYFAAARGAPGAPAADMSKYFDTNYHYLVPELTPESGPTSPDWSLLLDRVARGQAVVGVEKAVPILLGPNTLVGLAKGDFARSEVVARLVPAYRQLLETLKGLGVPEIHEPILTRDDGATLEADFGACYASLAGAGVPINLVVYYDDVSEATYKWLVQLPVAAVSLDFKGVPGNDQGCHTARLIAKHGFPQARDKRLGAGLIDGRAIWADQGEAAAMLAALRARLGPDQRICLQTSTPLQHVPYDKRSEEGHLPAALLCRIAFAQQKAQELAGTVATLRTSPPGSIPALNLGLWTGAAPTPAELQFKPELFFRSEAYEGRRGRQPCFPPFPTTTIGSFPQTPAIRRARLQFKKGALSPEEYRERMAAEIGFAIGAQASKGAECPLVEALGLDVLVHGEPERSDMVEYFGLKLAGFHFTENGWVQSYGSRYVRPPIIAGDVSRLEPMTVHEYLIAQGLTTKPVKGMLTGPVTILQWSFVRTDVSRKAQALQIAAALRGEVEDLQAAGCRIIQVDEPALREGLPLKHERWAPYLDWAVNAFRLATAVARPDVQVVTHLCYSDFEDIMGAIDAMDADVLTIENSRSGNEMIAALAASGYRRDVGPGVFDVHTPVVPTVGFMLGKLRSYMETGILGGDATRIHVNPDCGLKTRKWEEVLPALRNMVLAAKTAREEYIIQQKAGEGGAPVPAATAQAKAGVAPSAPHVMAAAGEGEGGKALAWWFY
uniref:5-methyltetrahydropteroyltriglutamate--homocysteine S-methyltransferase n=1 Tax=Parachlorella kessleri TaxID=3074 RepID=A0A146HUF9_PARKE|nr:METE; cobalamin-independent methionine synthase [Parachlorella kessleri]